MYKSGYEIKSCIFDAKKRSLTMLGSHAAHRRETKVSNSINRVTKVYWLEYIQYLIYMRVFANIIPWTIKCMLRKGWEMKILLSYMRVSNRENIQ